MAKEHISLDTIEPLPLFGELDKNLKLLSKNYDSTIVLRGNNIILQGEQEKISNLKLKLLSLIEEVKNGKVIAKEELAIGKVGVRHSVSPQMRENTCMVMTPKGAIKPRSNGQILYLKALGKFDVVICIGPAGTGKTFLAVAKAVEHLKKGTIQKIILTRPAVEAGEKLGFLPGDFKEKVDPYLRPLYDALYELVPHDKIKRYIEERVIEIIPLAYMRGRNLDNSFIILDEAQNARKIQMKMFLTRFGIGSKVCITGDVTQIDLSPTDKSGLLHIQQLLSGIQEIKFVQLSRKDIVRHPLVKEIIKAYEKESKH